MIKIYKTREEYEMAMRSGIESQHIFNDKKSEEFLALEKKLEIAIEALHEIKSKTFERYLMNNGWAAVTELRLIAQQALKEIKGCEKSTD